MLVNEITSSRELDTTIGLMVLGKVYQHHYTASPTGHLYCYACGKSDNNKEPDFARVCYAIVPKFSSSDTDAWSLFQHMKDSLPARMISLFHSEEGYTLDAPYKMGKWLTPLTHTSFSLLMCKTALLMFKIDYDSSLS